MQEIWVGETKMPSHVVPVIGEDAYVNFRRGPAVLLHTQGDFPQVVGLSIFTGISTFEGNENVALARGERLKEVLCASCPIANLCAPEARSEPTTVRRSPTLNHLYRLVGIQPYVATSDQFLPSIHSTGQGPFTGEQLIQGNCFNGPHLKRAVKESK